MTRPLLSIIVPCFNEQENISALFVRLEAATQNYKQGGIEVILIDDGSDDATWNEIETLCRAHAHVVGIRQSRNFGHQAAIACGLDHATGDRVLMIDADLQDPPELLSDMMQKMDEGYDVVHAVRRQREGETMFKKGAAWLFYRLLGSLSDVIIPPDSGDFKLLSRKAIGALKNLGERVRYTRGLISWLGMQQSYVIYTRAPRHAGSPGYSTLKSLKLASDGVTAFSTKPLFAPFWLGGILLIGSIVLSLLALLCWSGSLALIAGGLFLFAVQWLMLGVMGSYLATMHREIKGRPLYITDRILRAD